MSVPLAELPALPLHEAGKYVAAAYVVLFAIVLIYVAIMAVRLSRIEHELGELLELAEASGESRGQSPATPERDLVQESASAHPMKGHT